MYNVRCTRMYMFSLAVTRRRLFNGCLRFLARPTVTTVLTIRKRNQGEAGLCARLITPYWNKTLFENRSCSSTTIDGRTDIERNVRLGPSVYSERSHGARG